MTKAHVSQAAEHQRLGWLDGTTVSILFDSAATNGQLAVMRSTMARGAASPLHLHRREDEMFILISGTGLFHVGDEVLEVGPGGSVFLPRDVPHAYRIVSEEADMLTLCTPGGMEEFFRGAGHDLDRIGDAGWEVSMADLVAAAASGGQEILGPPPPLPPGHHRGR